MADVEQIAPLRLPVPSHSLATLDQERENGWLAARTACRMERREALHALVQHRVRTIMHERAYLSKQKPIKHSAAVTFSVSYKLIQGRAADSARRAGERYHR